MINKILSVLVVSCVMFLMLINVVGINSNSYKPSQVNTSAQSADSEAVSLKDVGGPGPTKTPSPYTMPIPSSAMSDIQDVQTVGVGTPILATIQDNVLAEVKVKTLTTAALANYNQ